MKKKNLLFEIADNQQGYFTTQQAEECGISRSNFHLKIRSGEWQKELRGIYRLSNYPTTERPELALWTLWSKDRNGIPQGVWSHETALDIFELSDVMPAKMHFTVPLHFRRRSPIPKQLQLHFSAIQSSDSEERQGYRVTKPLRTVMDVLNEGTLSNEHVASAIKDGLQRGLLTIQEMQKAATLVKSKGKKVTAEMIEKTIDELWKKAR